MKPKIARSNTITVTWNRLASWEMKCMAQKPICLLIRWNPSEIFMKDILLSYPWHCSHHDHYQDHQNHHHNHTNYHSDLHPINLVKSLHFGLSSWVWAPHLLSLLLFRFSSHSNFVIRSPSRSSSPSSASWATSVLAQPCSASGRAGISHPPCTFASSHCPRWVWWWL